MNNTKKATKMELTKDDKEYIDSVNDSSMSEEKKRNIIRLVKANRAFFIMMMKEFDLNPRK